MSTIKNNPQAISSTTNSKKSLVADLKNHFKGVGKLFSQPKAQAKEIAKNSQQAEIGKSQAFSNRSGPGENQSITQNQSKEISQSPSENNSKITSNNAETPQNGKEIGADLKVPGCSGGCGCGCTG